jgi:hypothetical protein
VDLADVFDMGAFTMHADIVFARLRHLIADREAVRV